VEVPGVHATAMHGHDQRARCWWRRTERGQCLGTGQRDPSDERPTRDAVNHCHRAAGVRAGGCINID